MLRFKAFLVDLERIGSAAVILVGPLPKFALRESVLARGFGYRDLAFEDFEDDRRLSLRGPSLERPLVRLRLGRLVWLSHWTPSFRLLGVELPRGSLQYDEESFETARRALR